MLAALSIRDIVLIDRLDLEFQPGLAVLSGETGAGKSIVLDALALALGARGEASMVRHGASQGSVTAVFSVGNRPSINTLLAEQGMEAGEEIVLRRVQHADGRTRAFLNDEPIGVRLMRDLGHLLVEIHGQHDERALLEPAAHLAVIDAYGGHGDALAALAADWTRWREADEALAQHSAEVARVSADADYLRHALDELSRLAPEVGEEEGLAAERQLMMAGERIAEDLARAESALSGEGGAEASLSRAASALSAAETRAGETLEQAIDALERTRTELSECVRELAQARSRSRSDPPRLEAVEERLFALRAAGRKHGVSPDALPALAATLETRLAAIEEGGERLAKLEAARDVARKAWLIAASELSSRRRKAARRLEAAVAAELAPLRLEKARFEVRLATHGEDGAGPSGLDRAEFMIATIEGAPLGPLRRVASGGELSRVMLAIKVALAGRGGAPTLVFDEIDSGVGGAVADAVGERLQRLGSDLQVLVVTHSPQVAARAHDHLLIERQEGGAAAGESGPRTHVRRLDATARREEIARMLAGARITEEARAAAGRLIGSAAE